MVAVIKIEAAHRLTAADRLPPWSTTQDADQYVAYVKQGRLPWGRVSLSVVARIKETTSPDWNGWNISPDGAATIFIQDKFFAACIKHKALWALAHLIQHEYVELKTAVKLARERYPGANPYVVAETHVNLGGEAHVKAIKILDNMTESQYDSYSKTEARYLRLR